MKCIYCARPGTEVVNSREAKGGFATWRRRQCRACARIFTTTERGGLDNLFVVKSRGRRQRFVYEKLFVSIFAIISSVKHHDNGSDALLSKKIAEGAIKELFDRTKGNDVQTKEIILVVYEALRKVDPAFAERYIYYSNYRRKVGSGAGIVKFVSGKSL